MSSQQLYDIYAPNFDRFIVTSNPHLIGIDEIISTKITSTYEYFRYLPDTDVTLKDIDDYLRSKPREICFEITRKCNLRCPVCISDSQILSRSELSFEVISEILKNSLVEDIPRVTITGGEPTLHSDFLNIVKLLGFTNKSIIFSTNGYLTGKVELAVSDIDNIILAMSLHGTEEVHDNFVKCKGAFKRVLQCIATAASCHKIIHIYSTITQGLLDCLPQICELLSEFPISELRLNIIKQGGRINGLQITQRNYESALEVVKRIEAPFRIQIKRKGQPFLFINYLGEKLIHE